MGVMQQRQHPPGDVGEPLRGHRALEVAVHRMAGLTEQVAQVAAHEARVRRLRGRAVGLQRVLGVELAAMEQQRRGVRAVAAALHLADEDDVVALLVAAAVEAFESGRRAGQQRRAARTLGEGHAGPAVRAARGEALGQRLLVGRQDVDGVVRAGTEGRQRAGRARQAPEHQRRIERNRIERIGGQAHTLAFGRAGRDDGDTRGKHAQAGAELPR